MIYMNHELDSNDNQYYFISIILFIDFIQLILGYKWINESEEDSLEFDAEKTRSDIH